MRTGYFDCFSGASGDMILGALTDAGMPVEELREALAGLNVTGFEVKASRVKRGAFVGTKVDVTVVEEGHPERRLRDLLEILDRSRLEELVRQTAVRIFTRLAEAEARVHGSTPERIHFHEVGALDALVDVVGAAWGLRRLGLERVLVSPLNLGSGTVEAAHGRLPVPAPGTAELLRGVPAYTSPVPAELTTPTGAAILTTVASGFGPLPALTVERIGYGAGQRELPDQPNLLRLIVGETADSNQQDTVTIIEANIDDMNPQFFEPLLDRLYEAGALEAFLTPVTMKKSRPGVLLTILAEPTQAEACAELVLAHTTTFGVRMHGADRRKLRRETISVETPFGPIRVKVGRRGGGVHTLAPEYEDCKRASRTAGVPIQRVHEAAREAARDRLGT